MVGFANGKMDLSMTMSEDPQANISSLRRTTKPALLFVKFGFRFFLCHTNTLIKSMYGMFSLLAWIGRRVNVGNHVKFSMQPVRPSFVAREIPSTGTWHPSLPR